jgi:hypothetical protein
MPCIAVGREKLETRKSKLEIRNWKVENGKGGREERN